ncbi:hypothetical protein EAI_01057 [Harpegnathos saltator]|uniref:Uncharacterized protein n=1 Tax=Harpegnathos saltator TaxID=610380 RepID=E2BL91_HARSA|nr:hypothetical protein EAI_01057 [Harpegnathos saltator]
MRRQRSRVDGDQREKMKKKKKKMKMKKKKKKKKKKKEKEKKRAGQTGARPESPVVTLFGWRFFDEHAGRFPRGVGGLNLRNILRVSLSQDKKRHGEKL